MKISRKDFLKGAIGATGLLLLQPTSLTMPAEPQVSSPAMVRNIFQWLGSGLAIATLVGFGLNYMVTQLRMRNEEVMTEEREDRVVERFKKRTIWFHWIHTVAFLVLLVTGATLFFPWLGGLAAGDLTRSVHRIAVIFFVGAPIVYFMFNPKMSIHFIKETLTWDKDDFEWVQYAPDYYFGGEEWKMLPQGHVNTGQKMWQLIILVTSVLFLISGFVMWFLKDTVSTDVFQWCVVIHDFAFILAFLMLLVHIYLGAVHPRMTESFRSMIDGKISRTYARSHYGKWYEKISASKK